MRFASVPRGSVSIVLVVLLTGVLAVAGYGLHAAQRTMELAERETWRHATQYAAESAVNWALAYCRQYGIPPQQLRTEPAYPYREMHTEVIIIPRGDTVAVIIGTASGRDTQRRIRLRLHTVATGEHSREIEIDEVRG